MAADDAVADDGGVAQFATHRPPAALRPYVAAAHGYRVPANPTGRHRGLPSRHLTLVLELAAPLRVDGLRGGPVTAHGVAGGLHLSPASIDASAPQDGVQYALTPLGARALLGVPAAELAGLAVDLGALIGPRAAEWVERLHAAQTWAERFGLLDGALLQRLADHAGRGDPAGRRGEEPAEVAEAWRLVFATGGRVRVAEVAAHVGWSRRHLAERFRLATGVTPKQAARIARFEASKRLLMGAPRSPLAEVAVRCGYADQAHLAREWQQFAGCSVGTWLREELQFVQDVGTAGGEDR